MANAQATLLASKFEKSYFWNHYDGHVLRGNPGLQYLHLHGPVHTPDYNRWDTPPV